MSRRGFAASSVGTKILIALTGLALLLYLIVHLAGNLLVLAGPEVFNDYAHRLVSNPLIVPLEIGLLAVFLLHIYKTARMWIDNRRARPVAYQVKAWAGRTSRKTVASSTMIVSGVAILAFVILHVRQFRFGTVYEGPGGVRDLYRLEVEIFQQPEWVVLYVASMALVGLHLRHGIASAFQSLGVGGSQTARRLLAGGLALAIALAAGFAFIPLWVYFAR
ncbi:MAG TPA: succinate dehydrogenase cytochrome b subunit [Vicinamibacterales bacterium]|nr:succinate dehydrogenase cytochrome b subunit [Vicinamibacterales bacterium]